IVASCRCPPCRCLRRFHRVADILPITFSDLGQYPPIRTSHQTTVARVGAHLLPTDEQLGRTVDRRPEPILGAVCEAGEVQSGRAVGRGDICSLFLPMVPIGFLEGISVGARSGDRGRLQVLEETLATAFTPESALAVTTESGGSVEDVGA